MITRRRMFPIRNSLQTAVVWFLVVFSADQIVPSFAAEMDLGTTLVVVRFGRQHNSNDKESSSSSIKDGDTNDNCCGIVVASDTRTSVSNYVSHRTSTKMDCIGSSRNPVVLLRSGSAAATQYVARSCQQLSHICSNRYGQDLSVSEIAQYCSNMIREQQQKQSSTMSLIVAGLSTTTNHNGHDIVPMIYTIAPSGAVLQEAANYATSGSGSVYILGYLQQYFASRTTTADQSTHATISKQEAIKLCLRALQLAKQIDASSGGWTRLMILEHEKENNIVTTQYQVIRNNNGDDEVMTMTPSPLQPVDSLVPLRGFADPIKKDSAN